jgi:hypothetical protein
VIRRRVDGQANQRPGRFRFRPEQNTLHAVAGVQIEHMFSTIGGLWARRYPCLSIILKRGRPVWVKADLRISALIRARLAKANPASWSRP